LNHNLDEQLEIRRFLSEYCFEKLRCDSISFVKQASLHLYSELEFNGIVVDLGAELTQISPVDQGYTSQFSSNFFKITGRKIDEFMYKLLYHKFNLNAIHGVAARPPRLDMVSLYKIKQDLKETSLSPYQIPFNFEVLNEKLQLDPHNKNAYRQYVLPDKKTLVNIDIGRTEKEIIKELIYLYHDSSLFNFEPSKYFGNVAVSEDDANADPRKIKRKSEINERKGLTYRVCQTIDQYVKDECIEPEMIQKVLLTGGALKLKSHESKRSLKSELQKALENGLQKYPNVAIVCADEPQYGSIMNGARILYSMPQFDQYMSVSKKEWLFDDQIVTKKLF
jgi:actin-related protein